MTDAKAKSEQSGKQFLQDSFALEQELLGVRLRLSSESITHSATKGDVNEGHFINILRRYLPRRYAVDRGIAIDCTGATSDQIDVIIFDNQYTPILLDQENHRYIPAEAIYCVLEAKPNVDKGMIAYASAKAASVRSLTRTSVPIAHAGGEHPAKELFPIIAGIIAGEVSWAEGFESQAFLEAWTENQGEGMLDCGLGVSGGCFDAYSSELHFGPQNNGLMYFLFRLLQKLQSLGTVPAIDWNAYADVLSAE